MDALGIPRAVLAGHNWGGRAACVAAALWPERCRGMVTVNSYLIQDLARAMVPISPKYEVALWYEYYFQLERGRAGLAANRREIARILWEQWSPEWDFDDATFERSAMAHDNPDYVDVVIHSYRHRFGLAAGDPQYADLQRRLASLPPISVPSVTLDGDKDGVLPASDGSASASKFTGRRIHRVVPGAGHNVPQEAPEAFAAAVMELIRARLGRVCRMVKPLRKPSSSLRKSSKKDRNFTGRNSMASVTSCLQSGFASFASIASASAEEFPSRPITWVVPFAPGGITDTTSRIVAEEMSRTLGQSVLIDNRGGGGGTVGTEQVARARPDGYTMIYGTQGTMAANVTLRKNLSYDPLTSFLPVHLVGESPNLFVAYHDAPYNSVPEFIAYAKQNPGKVTFSSSGVGTATHLVAELFKTVTGIEMQHVPYRGSAPALNDMIAGRVDVMFDYPVSVGPHVEAGKLKVLATTAPERLRAFPDVPTMAELGMKDMTTQSWSSIMVPAGTPAPVVDRLAAAAHAALSSERVRTHFEKVGTRPMMLQKAEMIPFIEKEIKRWGDVIERAGLEKQ